MKIRHTLTVGLGGLISFGLLLTWLLALFPVTIRVDHDWLKPLALIIASGLYLGGIGLLFRYLHRLPKRFDWWVTGGLWALLLLIQLWVATAWVAAPRADLYFVHQQALDLLQGSHHWAAYFYTYPNNVTFTLLLSTLMHLGTGVTLNLIQFIWLDCGLVAVWHVLRQHNPARANLFLSLVITAVPLYAYALNTYTDVYVLPLIMLAVVTFYRLQQAETWQQIVGRSLLLSLFLVAAYLLKANLVVLLIATLLTLWLRPNQAPHQSVTRCLFTLILLATLIAGTGLTHNWQRANGYRLNPDQALPALSWVAMSWNPDYSGQYNRPDVTHIRQQPTQSAKQAWAKTTLTHRLDTLGPAGISDHLYQKARLFLANGTFDSFQVNPAFDRAPNWYRQHRATSDWFLASWCQITYLTLLLVNLGWGIQQLRRCHLTATYLLGGLAFIGLACFHIIFWEAEERYALPLLPLLLAGTAAGYRQPVNVLRYSLRSRWLPLGVGAAFTVLLGIAAWQNAGLMVHSNSEPVSVVSQTEGRYYQNHRLTVAPHHTLTQPFTASLPFDQIIINQGQRRLTGRLILRDAHGKVVWQSRGQRPRLTWNFPPQMAGHYTLSVTNRSTQPLQLVTAPATYCLLPHAIIGHANQYLQFRVQQQSVAPVLSNGKFWLLFGGMWLSGLLIVDRFYWYRRQI